MLNFNKHRQIIFAMFCEIPKYSDRNTYNFENLMFCYQLFVFILDREIDQSDVG